MLRKATADDLPALTALRCGAAKAGPVDAAGWLQTVSYTHLTLPTTERV